MNKKYIFVFMFVIFIFSGCSKNTNNKLTETKNDNGYSLDSKNVTTTTPTSTLTNEHIVKISNLSFNPEIIEVNYEDTIIWENNDSINHQIVSNGEEATRLNDLVSIVIKPGEKYVYKSHKSGTFDYICGLHPDMKARLIIK